ncbi:glucose-1-phosphate adenylyltransferase [Enemella evansiae]|uniref:Glucose-1-phosphate adenylyltransferase n=1 Tax=Enemella evansiae TaxID=2016499 RepID=A0A255GEB2_9ACTN|nr:glucose-1-phosphate adenylyltransferase [Enemella evansiae]OYN96747.1 glucose-1-phosphate adenylyltransferase [Enemella evansiae]OYO08212.1 glucose-1-phosphate adenylyltransferase [Enemella evansiae]OYO12633.1 glucose-1-phosphate adenylyltransferase [Enemella evansiae]OYO18985.1 glucose-1-phosphate adenylyltransferase [Enemella evansiae]
MTGGRPRVLSIVLAGGEGKRLMPLTADRAKPAVPFGGTYRLIDFVLSNLVNSDLRQICVLTQYKSHSLDRHISLTWRMSTMLGNYVTPVPAQQRLGPRWYQGSADAIFQSMNLINDDDPDYVVVFGADNIYRMDVSQMLNQHIESGLGCTVAGIRVPRREASAFGIIDAGTDNKIKEFLEKPADPPGLPDSPEESFASMGNYIFTRDALVEALEADAADTNARHDMGGDIIPRFVERGQAQVHDFTTNSVPGATAKDQNYWRDVGTIDAYHEAHMDLVSVNPNFSVYNDEWPIWTYQPQRPGAKFVLRGNAEDSIVSAGCIISGGDVDASVLSPNVRVDKWANVEHSVIMDNVRIGRNAVVRKAILDKNVVVDEGCEVGVDAEKDRARGFTISPNGVTVVGKGVHVTRD